MRLLFFQKLISKLEAIKKLMQKFFSEKSLSAEKPKRGPVVWFLVALLGFISPLPTFLKVERRNSETQKRNTRILKMLCPNFEERIFLFTVFYFRFTLYPYKLGLSHRRILLNLSLPWNFSFSIIIRPRTLYQGNVVFKSFIRYIRFPLLSVYVICVWFSKKNPLLLLWGLEFLIR